MCRFCRDGPVGRLRVDRAMVFRWNVLIVVIYWKTRHRGVSTGYF